MKKEVKTEKPDTLGNVKFESPILSIDPDVDPEESKESPDVKVSSQSGEQGGWDVGSSITPRSPARCSSHQVNARLDVHFTFINKQPDTWP